MSARLAFVGGGACAAALVQGATGFGNGIVFVVVWSLCDLAGADVGASSARRAPRRSPSGPPSLRRSCARPAVPRVRAA